MRTKGHVALGLALAVGLCGCEPHYCVDIGCAGAATLTGSIPLPETMGLLVLEVEFCGPERCLTGQISVEAYDSTDCMDGFGGSSVCLARRGEHAEVRATLFGSRDPREGDLYTLRLVELESSEVLLDEARPAHVKTTYNEDACLTCTSASMEL